MFKSLRSSWSTMTTVEKIDMVMDIIVAVGSSLIGTAVSKKVGAGHNKLGKLCVGITCGGLSLAIGDTAKNAIHKNYSEPIGKIIDACKNKSAKEETSDE